MARGQTLSTIRTMLKAEIGDFAGTNSTRDGELNVRLSNEQKRLAAEHNWAFLERRWDVGVTAGQQYPTLPTTTAGDPETEVLDINMDREPTAEVYWNTVYQPMQYGIGEDEYNVMNHANGQDSDPIQRWRIATNPNEPNNPNKFEVWPVPVTAQVVRFTGQRQMQALSADADTADLDDMLLIYFVAASILMRDKQADAQYMLMKAQRHLQWLKQQDKQVDKRRVLGQGSNEFNRERRLTGMIIAVR